MASRQRPEKKGMGAQVKARLGHKQQAGIISNLAQTAPINKLPHGYSMVIPTQAMPSSKYAYVAGNLRVSTHNIPINKQPIMNAPLQSVIKSKQPFTHQQTALSVASRINQPPLDVAMPSSQSFWRLRPHPSLDFDVHRQKIVPKKNQVAVSGRQLSPYLQLKENERETVADVIEVPPELFQLKDLKDILSLEAWKSHLSPSERNVLRGLLPEGLDNKSLVRAITGGDNFFFGNPLIDWGNQLLKGEMHPDFVQQKEFQLKKGQDEHYQEVHSYRDKMLQTLRVLKEEWILCKSVEQRLLSKPKRRKSRVYDCSTTNEGNAFRQKRKRQKVESFSQASGKMDGDSQSIKNRLVKGVHNDDCTQDMHILKVTRKQYADVLRLMKGEGDELELAALGSVLNNEQKIEIDLANGCISKDFLKTCNFWFKVVVNDIPAAHAVFAQRKTDKERLASSAAEQCLQYYSVFMGKEDEIDQQSNSDAILLMEAENPQEDEIDKGSNSDAIVPIETENLILESRRSTEENMRNSLASESSVTCLEEQAETHVAVESCLSSVDCSGDMLSQRLIQQEQVSLIDLPSGSSLVGEGHATLLPMVQAERKGQSLETEYMAGLEERSDVNIPPVRTLEMDTLSECNEGSAVLKPNWADKSLDVQETRSSCIDHVHCDLHLKPGSEVVSASAAAASGESEEVNQRVIHQLEGANLYNALNHQSSCWSGPITLIGQKEITGRNSLYTSSSKGCKDTQELVAHQVETYQKVIGDGIFQESAPSMGKSDLSKDAHAKDYGHMFEMDDNQAINDQSNQMMLHLFPDDSGFLSSEVSSSHGKKVVCGRDEAMPLASGCDDGEHTLEEEQEPITELSLLVDDRSAGRNFLTEQADSVSSRSEAEFGLHDALVEPHWMQRNKLGTSQAYPFDRSAREIHQSVQSSQDAYSPHSFTPVQPGWHNPQHQMPQHGYVNHWSTEEGADQTNWGSTEAAMAPTFFSASAKDVEERRSVSSYWDQLSRGPCMGGWSMKQDPSASFIRRPTPADLQDEQFFQAQEGWGSVYAHPSSAHLPIRWAMDRSGRLGAYPWKNTSVLSHVPAPCEQQKVQNAFLSKMNPNFSATWHG